MTSGCGTYCTFSWLINGLVTFLGIFHAVTRDWGLAIICLVIVVRIILHPITKKSTISMHKMTKMAPEIERLKKKYGDNKEELNKAMIDVYKQQGATPILGCLPMLLQTPIWIALWTALSSTFELRGAPFLWGATWIHDLSAPDRLFTFSSPIPLLFGFKLASINLLPIVLGFVFYLQQKYMPQAPAMTPEQQQQKKIMLWMTVLIFPLFLYGQPSGLTLYILTSTAIGILEQKRIRAHIKEQEEKEKSAIEVVDAGQTRGGKLAARDRKPATTPAAAPKKGFGGFVARMQARLEEIQRQQQQQQKSKKRK
jgi:YidC/Oxa1 family membrane protein insertase